MQIGHRKLRNHILLAPIAGVTDRRFRKLCRKWGAGMAVSKLESVLNAVDVPVTLKFPASWNSDHRNVAAIAESAGSQATAMHGRIRARRFNDTIDYDLIAA